MSCSNNSVYSIRVFIHAAMVYEFHFINKIGKKLVILMLFYKKKQPGRNLLCRLCPFFKKTHDFDNCGTQTATGCFLLKLRRFIPCGTHSNYRSFPEKSKTFTGSWWWVEKEAQYTTASIGATLNLW